MKQQLLNWLISQQPKLDQIIRQAAANFYNQNKGKENFIFDLRMSIEESFQLSQSKDLCYDRPSTPLAYSLWYHPKRVNTFLSFFLDYFLSTPKKNLEVFDLGAGTGAIQWSLGLIYVGLKKLGKTPPNISLINIDTSPFMMGFGKDFLWPEFLREYTEIDSNFNVVYEVNSWNNEQNIQAVGPIIAASYLFDSSDNREEIVSDFKELVKKFNPEVLLLSTSSQPQKVKMLGDIQKDFFKIGYQTHVLDKVGLIFNQPLEKVNEIRRRIGQINSISSYTNGYPASWNDKSHSGLILSKTVGMLNYVSPNQGLSIFNPPMIVRREVKLNPVQKKAAELSDRPVIIVGPAGCGKSIVITEKIKNIVEASGYNPNLEILVTTFNVGLIKKLIEWIKNLLDPTKYSFKNDPGFKGPNPAGHFIFSGSDKTNIRLLHFDMLPKYLASVAYNGLVDVPKHERIILEKIEEVKKLFPEAKEARFNNILNPEFIMEEHRRVIYGLQLIGHGSRDKYYSITRTGRGSNPSLRKNSERRKLVYEVMYRYVWHIREHKIPCFTLRKQELYGAVLKGEVSQKYDHILIDEFQDCTDADFEIFFRLAKNPNNITFAGDLAQAIHLGTSAKIPKDERMKNRRNHRLEGSYRLPVRISEAIQEVSKALVQKFANDEGVNHITPYKGSPPGARPIIVYGTDELALAPKVKSIFESYQIFDLKRITILEKDRTLRNELGRLGLSAETDSILALKGLEKECVLWATSVPLEFENEVFEFAYTIVTRTSSILIITLTDSTQPVYKKILGMLKRDRLILWDEETASKFDSFCEVFQATAVLDED